MKETAGRIGEVAQLRWKDLDTERKTITISNPEKGSKARIIPISNELINILNQLKRTNDTILSAKKHSLACSFYGHRKKTAKKLSQPRLLEIHPHTFRHWKATMIYHETKDIMHVRYILGHKSVESTQVYVHIEKQLFHYAKDNWNSLITHNIEEEQKAIEAGFELVRAINETTALYRKRK